MHRFRADRLATLYLVHPFLRHCLPQGPDRVSILMYHSVSSGGDGASRHPYYDIETSEHVFAQQMAFLNEHKFPVISLSDAVRSLQGQRALEPNSVVITFDDGYQNIFTSAFPVMSRYGFTATVYLPTAYIGDSHREFKGRNCLNWAEVQELRRAGITFGSHTVTHPRLADVPPAQLEHEIRFSKQEIEDHLGEAVVSFSFPYALPEGDRNFLSRFRELLAANHYRDGVSTRIGTTGPGDDLMFLRRLPVNTHDDRALLGAKLAGSYDWLERVQYAAKMMHSRAS